MAFSINSYAHVFSFCHSMGASCNHVCEYICLLSPLSLLVVTVPNDTARVITILFLMGESPFSFQFVYFYYNFSVFIHHIFPVGLLFYFTCTIVYFSNYMEYSNHDRVVNWAKMTIIIMANTMGVWAKLIQWIDKILAQRLWNNIKLKKMRPRISNQRLGDRMQNKIVVYTHTHANGLLQGHLHMLTIDTPLNTICDKKKKLRFAILNSNPKTKTHMNKRATEMAKFV